MLPRTVMLAEDNDDDVFLTVRILRKAGIDRISVVNSGQRILAVLQDPDVPLPDLLILDLRLPIIGGLKVLTEVRREARTKALPVLILSSSEDPRDLETCLRQGIIAFLNKPLELQNFQRLFS